MIMTMCTEKARDEDEKNVCCHDCKAVVPRKVTIAWRWYDFYAAQGDIPITVCRDCQKAPRHPERMRRDREDYEAEFGYRY